MTMMVMVMMMIMNGDDVFKKIGFDDDDDDGSDTMWMTRLTYISLLRPPINLPKSEIEKKKKTIYFIGACYK